MFRRQGFLQLKRIATRCEGEVLRRSGKCLNSVQLIGYTGGDPVKGSTDYQPTKFSLATTQYYTSREEKLESRTQWHNITVFRPRLQDTVNSYVRKGPTGLVLQYKIQKNTLSQARTRLFVEGQIDYNNYVDQEGIKRFSTSIIPSNIIILSQPMTVDEEPGYGSYQ